MVPPGGLQQRYQPSFVQVGLRKVAGTLYNFASVYTGSEQEIQQHACLIFSKAATVVMKKTSRPGVCLHCRRTSGIGKVLDFRQLDPAAAPSESCPVLIAACLV